jgi:hypothetical protein
MLHTSTGVLCPCPAVNCVCQGSHSHTCVPWTCHTQCCERAWACMCVCTLARGVLLRVSRMWVPFGIVSALHCRSNLGSLWSRGVSGLKNDWCGRSRAEQSKGRQNGCKMNILNKNFDSLRSANFKLFGRMKGNTVNDDFFKDHYFSYWRPFWLFTPGVKNRSYTSAGSHFPRFMWCMLFLAGRDGRTVNSDELPVNPICEGMWKHACVPHWASWKHLSHHRKLLSV